MSFPDQPRSAPRSAILLLAHGTPDVLSEMAPYLHHVTGGRPMPAHVVEELQHRYAEIGLAETPLPEGPPLTRWTLVQARMLAETLASDPTQDSTHPTPVYVGMRNWHPFIADTVARMRADGITHARALCLAPQYSRTSTGLYRRALMQAVGSSIAIDFLAGWADEPLLAEAFAERMTPAWQQAQSDAAARICHPGRAAILFTAHAVPCRTIMSAPAATFENDAASPSARPNGPVPEHGIQNYGTAAAPDPYPVECKQTAVRIASALGLEDSAWFFAFQSQGIAGAPWLGPTVPDTLAALAQSGYTHVVLQPVGFLCDHVEILYDIDIDFKQQAAELGLTLSRAGSLNDSTTLVRGIQSVLAHRNFIRLSPESEVATALGPGTDRPTHPVPVLAAT